MVCSRLVELSFGGAVKQCLSRLMPLAMMGWVSDVSRQLLGRLVSRGAFMNDGTKFRREDRMRATKMESNETCRCVDGSHAEHKQMRRVFKQPSLTRKG